MIYAHKATKAFYDSEAPGEIPEDAIAIEPELHQALLTAQYQEGKVIDWSGDLPVAVDRVITDEMKLRKLQTQAQARLDASDRVCIRCMKAGAEYPTVWLAYDELLRIIIRATEFTNQTLPEQPAYPDE